MKEYRELTNLQKAIMARRPRLKLIFTLGLIKWNFFWIGLGFMFGWFATTQIALGCSILIIFAAIWGVQTYNCYLYRTPFDDRAFENRFFILLVLPLPFAECAMCHYEMNRMNKNWNSKDFII